MEKQEQKKYAFVKLNNVWQRAIVTKEEDLNIHFKFKSGQEEVFSKDSKFYELSSNPKQRYAKKEVEEKLANVFIKQKEVDPYVKSLLSQGQDAYYEYTYKDTQGVNRDGVKMLRMKFDQDLGSKLDVTIKSNKEFTLANAVSRNYQFTKEEYNQLIMGKQVLYNAVSKDGEQYPKIGWYSEKLNQVIDRSLLSENTYVYGQKLTHDQAKSLNEGETIKFEYTTKGGEKNTVDIYYDAKGDKTRSPKNEQAKNLDVTFEEVGLKTSNEQGKVKNSEKKNSKKQGITM
ncbi:Protein of unknown function [Tenacibaculum sp. MAR_2009_124]|uniref:DUF3945 domain-containing protein n=1 Tax=Tenacibaculum sp. MAR_2009_124 TaxID=1250059 RepID=UPI000897FD55|nr:DUF3945 domain-containing protein [Tenacibaculum sp. MAR_2009_124]SEC64259.1 Protein of unknown function [Tenacibaculum sp. MAR_2009_124]